MHKTPREIERETGISRSTLRNITKCDLNLTPCKRVKGRKLSPLNEKKRRKRVPLLLKKVTSETLNFFYRRKDLHRWYTEKHAEWPSYDNIGKKNEIGDERLFTTKNTFSKNIMICWKFPAWKNFNFLHWTRRKSWWGVLQKEVPRQNDSTNEQDFIGRLYLSTGRR